MFLKNLKLTNFRNFSSLDLDFAPATLLIGNNAQGKSNLIESIYFLATTKSYRVEKDVQLIKGSENVSRVEGLVVEKVGEEEKLEIVMQIKQEEIFGEIGEKLEKRLKINGIPKRAIDYIGNLVVVFFSPEDINLVLGSPSIRRWHIDLTLAQVDREYKRALTTYTQALASRNRVLRRVREGLAKVDELDFWTEQLVESGNIVGSKRQKFFNFINENISTLGEAAGFLNGLVFRYQQNKISHERLADYLPREIASATTLIGIHRDDFSFLVGEQNLAHFGSRGEMRTAVLDLKLAELQFIKIAKQVEPILLLDDIFSELDEKHRDYVISAIGKQQTILSAIDESQVPNDFLNKAKLFRIEKGQLK